MSSLVLPVRHFFAFVRLVHTSQRQAQLERIQGQSSNVNPRVISTSLSNKIAEYCPEGFPTMLSISSFVGGP